MFAFLALAVFIGGEPAFAQTPAPDASAAAGTPCAAGLQSLYPLDAAAQDGAADEYIVNLATYAKTPLTVSGTLALFAGDDRYDVVFTNATAVPVTVRDTQVQPLVLRFPAAVKLSAGYLSALSSPTTSVCSPEGTISDFRRTDITRLAAKNVTALAAQSPVREPLPSCAVPFATAHPTHISRVMPSLGASQNGEYGGVRTLVQLDSGGNVVDATLLVSSGYQDLDDAGLQTARRTKYSGAIFRCEPIRSAYLLGVYFGQ